MILFTLLLIAAIIAWPNVMLAILFSLFALALALSMIEG